MAATNSPTSIPLVDVQRQVMAHGEAISRVLAEAAARGDYILGEAVGRFEGRWASYVAAAEAVGVGNGTDALTLALRGLGIGPGDVALTQANTFAATALAVRHAGATLALCDVDPQTGAIDVGSYVGPEPAVVLPVHLFGRPVDLGPIRARFPDARIVEDACQAHGASLGDGRCGSMGDAAAFSFYPSKNLGALGDGGVVTTNDPAVAARVRELRHLGASSKYVHASLGVNSRLDTLQAAVLDYKLDHLPAWNARRRALAARYLAALADVDDVVLPADAAGHVWHLFVVRVPRRDAVLEGLRARGVGAGIHYPTPVHRQPVFADGFIGQSFPHAERMAGEILSLPLFPEMTDDEVDTVVAALRESLRA